MNNLIILSASAFGSAYLLGKSLELMNNYYLYKKEYSRINIINGLTFAFSGSIFLYNCYLLNITHCKFFELY